MNLDELVRTALVEETRAEPDEGGAYDRFLQRRKRSVLRTAASTGLAVALVLALAIGTAQIVRGGSGGRGAGPLAPAPTTARAPGSTQAQGPAQTTLAVPTSVPISADGVVRRERQGFELTCPTAGGSTSRRPGTTTSAASRGWSSPPGGDDLRTRRPPAHHHVHRRRGAAGVPGPSARRPGPLGSVVRPPVRAHLDRTPARRPRLRRGRPGWAAPLRDRLALPVRAGRPVPGGGAVPVIRMEVEGTDGKQGRAMRALTRNLVDSIRPVTNALPPTGAIVEEEPGLFADAPVVVGRGGQGDYAWEMRARKGSGQEYWIETRRQNGKLFMGELFSASDRGRLVAWIHCAPSKEQVTATLVSGLGPEAAAKVVLELKGQPPVEVPTFHKQGFPFAFWVVAPLPPDARPRAFTGFDAAGKQVGHGTDFAGYPGGCR